MTEQTRHPLAARFERFARESATMGSTFYKRLSAYVAGNDTLLDIAALVPRPPVPNMFFGAAHYLLLAGADHELRDFYPSIAPWHCYTHGRSSIELLPTLARVSRNACLR